MSQLGLTEEQQKLVNENLRLIDGAIHKYTYNIEHDDFWDIGAIGLCKAAATFNPNLGYKFSTYAYKVILNEINMEFRRLEKQSRLGLVELDAPIGDLDKDGEITLGDVLRDNSADAAFDKIDDSDIVEKLRVRLSNLELRIFDGLLDGKTQSEAARDLGISRQAVGNSIRAIRIKYRKLIDENNRHIYKVC